MISFLDDYSLIVLPAITIILSLSFFIFLNKKDKSNDLYSREFKLLLKKVEDLDKIITNNDSLEKEKDELVNFLSEKIKSEASQKILEDFIDSNIQKNYFNLIIRNFDETTFRLEREISRHNLKSNSNLMFGLLFALFGMITTLYFISPDLLNISIKSSNLTIERESNGEGIISFIKEYLPKISIIIIIETFVYFFLKLYKSSLDHIKYLTNELTSVRHRFLAVQLSLFSDNGDMWIIKECIDELIKFEKNKSEMNLKDFDGKISIEVLSQLLSSMNKNNNTSSNP